MIGDCIRCFGTSAKESITRRLNKSFAEQTEIISNLCFQEVENAVCWSQVECESWACVLHPKGLCSSPCSSSCFKASQLPHSPPASFALEYLPPPSLVAQTVKRLPTMQETRVRFLDWEDPLEKEMATHSNILGWKIPWTEEPGRLQSVGLGRKESDTTEWLHFHFSWATYWWWTSWDLCCGVRWLSHKTFPFTAKL